MLLQSSFGVNVANAIEMVCPRLSLHGCEYILKQLQLEDDVPKTRGSVTRFGDFMLLMYIRSFTTVPVYSRRHDIVVSCSRQVFRSNAFMTRV